MHAKFLISFVTIWLLPAAAPAADAVPAGPPAAAASESSSGTRLSATLRGAEEVDAQGKAGQGDPDGSGSFVARIDKGQLCYTLSSANIGEATMAHIHKGAVGAGGPVFIGLPDLDGGEHCQDIDDDRAAALRSKPETFYVNIHNDDFPAGAIRGQLTKP